jgi:hypothetical protein
MTEQSMRRPDRPPDLEVELRHYSIEEGGLKGPLLQGCRLPNDFGVPGEMNDGMYIFKADPPGPGETASAELWLLVPEQNAGRLREGFKFFPWHMRLIGEGTVQTVVNPELRSVAGLNGPEDQA